MKLSIITICYNEKQIRRTCESIVNQSWQDFEWIVVDGGSTDETLDILRDYKDRIDVLISEKDNGVYDAMNKGIKKASGEWLSFMNGGDSFYSSDVLKKTFGSSQNFDTGILYGSTYTPEKEKFRKYPKKLDRLYFIGKNINHQSTFIRRNLFEKYGLYDDKMKIAADFDKWCQFMTNGEKFQSLNFCVAANDLLGISSNPKYREIQEREYQTAIERNYTAKDLKRHRSKQRWSLKTFGKIIKAYTLFPWYIYQIYSNMEIRKKY